MRASIEATLARARDAGITQLSVDRLGEGGRLRLAGDREVLSFATCSYLGLERDPRLCTAAIEAVSEWGICFSASRCFLSSPLYARAEGLLREVFGRPVLLAGSTTLAHGAALPILVEPEDVVLYDRQVHHSVQSALAALGRRPRREMVPHADWNALEAAIQRALAQGARRIWYCADGIYSMFGDRLDVARLASLMGRYEALHAYLDDAHGMSWCGSRGGGSLVDARLPLARTVLATSLSKGFGCAGGLLVLPDEATRRRIEQLGPSLMFSIQLPPAMLAAVSASARIHLDDEIRVLQGELHQRLSLANRLLREDPVLSSRLANRADAPPTPVHYVVLGTVDRTIAVTQRLLAEGFLVNPVAYPAVPLGQCGVRFTITRAHTEGDVRALLSALSAAAQDSSRETVPSSET